MKVISFGRGSQNNVVVNDSKVSRVHCQIVQYNDGGFGVVDFGSTNGTFVNGRRITGEIRLNWNDTVQIGNTILHWQPYFDKSRKSKGMPVWAFGVAAAVLVAVIATVVFHSHSDLQGEILFEGAYPSQSTIIYTDGGEHYEIEAFAGQAIVFSREGVSMRQAHKAIERHGGKVVSQIPEMHYCLVSVAEGSESAFLAKMNTNPEVAYAFLHISEDPCSATVHIIDNMKYAEDDGHIHGQTVSAAAMICSPESISTQEHNIAVLSDDRAYLSDHKIIEAINNAFRNNTDATVLINTSFGQYLKKGKEIISWQNLQRLVANGSLTEREAQHLIDNWANRYKNSMLDLIYALKPYKDKDFILTKSSGNSGCPEFERVILAKLRKELKPEELEIIDKHILFVSAYDENRNYRDFDGSIKVANRQVHPQRWGQYADRPTTHDEWVTTTDISHLTYIDEMSVDGTSFAAPNALCSIGRIINAYGLTGKEALAAVKKVTRDDAKLSGGAGMLDVMALDTEAKSLCEGRRLTPRSVEPQTTNVNLSGEWRWISEKWIVDNAGENVPEADFTLEIEHRGSSISGYYMAVAKGGERIDIGEEISTGYDSQSNPINGEIDGNIASVRFQSGSWGGQWQCSHYDSF